MTTHTRTASPTADEARDEEVLRANKELAAYFKGQRTEREARAALKIIRAFVKDRARLEPAKRRPLPGLEPPKAPAPPREKKKGAPRRTRRSAKRKPALPDAISDVPAEPESGDV